MHRTQFEARIGLSRNADPKHGLARAGDQHLDRQWTHNSGNLFTEASTEKMCIGSAKIFDREQLPIRRSACEH